MERSGEIEFFTFYNDIYYSGRRLYQCNEDYFFILVLIVNKLVSNYKFTSNQTEAFNCQVLLTSVSMLLNRSI